MRQKIIAIATFLLLALNLSAQGKNDFTLAKNEFSISAGAGIAYMVDGIAGLSNLSKDYNNKMRFSCDYNFQIEYRISRFTIGAMVSVFNSSGSTEFTSDNIFINNYTMQLGGYWLMPNLHEVSLKTTAGWGITAYKNDSKTFGNKRHISEGSFACNISNEAGYRLSANLTITLNAILMWSHRWDFNVTYHGQTFEAYQNFPLSKIAILAGIKYTF